MEQNMTFAGISKTAVKKAQPRKDHRVSKDLNKIERQQIEIEWNKEIWSFIKLSKDIDQVLM